MKIVNSAPIVIFCIYLVISPGKQLLTAQSLVENPADSLLQEKATRVFLDLSGRTRWHTEYVKTEIPFVNYMRDRKQAEVYIMVTDSRTGAGGSEYTIKLIGQNGFQGVNDTLKYFSKQSEPDELVRKGITDKIKLGLMHYIGKTPQADFIDIRYKKKADPTDVIDKWNYWVFSFNVDTDFEGEESKKEQDFNASFSANRVTPESKVSMRIYNYYSSERFKDVDVWISSIRRSRQFRGLYVKSLGEHWSAGVYGSVYASTYSNTKWAVRAAPAIEYNLFPYSEYTSRELRFLYQIGGSRIAYEKETLYDKMDEMLYYHNLSGTFEMKKRWGSFMTTLEGSQYIHDFSKNRIILFANIDLLLFEGFSLDIRGYVSMIRDQLSLPKEDATQAEILLNKRQIATDYQYNFRIGIRYTFGSIYSNVVNPRFGN